MRLAEKTLELTLCSQLSWPLWGLPFLHWGTQPFWFGLTQMQEAKAGFDAATKLRGGKILLLQFKAGRRLSSGYVRFKAPHQQLSRLRRRVKAGRLIYYVLPEATQTSHIRGSAWLLANTWFLDVSTIPALAAPKRKSGAHLMTLNPTSGVVTITSDPVDVRAHRWEEITKNVSPLEFGRAFESFDKFWSYAKLMRRGGIGAVLPSM